MGNDAWKFLLFGVDIHFPLFVPNRDLLIEVCIHDCSHFNL